MGLLARIRSWFAPKPRPRQIVSDAQLVLIPDDIMMELAVMTAARTGKPVGIRRPNPSPQEGETEEQAAARFEQELDALAELLGVDREKAA